jgi:hypothetical protein
MAQRQTGPAQDTALMATRMGQAVQAANTALNDLRDANAAAGNAWSGTIQSYIEQLEQLLEGDGLGTDSGLADMWIKATNEARR